MRRYFKYIFLTLITVIFAASCIEEMESPQPMPQSYALTLVPRVKSFTNQYVTKAGEDEIAAKERTISKLSVFVFDNNNNLVHITKEASSTGSIDLNKSMLKNLELSSATIVMLANVELTNVKKTADHSLATEYTAFTDDDPNTAVTLTPADLVNYSLYIPNNQSVVTDVTSSDFKGFPMIGRSKADLSSSSKIEVGLKILYAKVNFEISVSEGGENQKYGKSDNEMTFSLNSCKVFNTSKQTSIAYPTEKDNPEFEFWGVAKDPAVNATSTSATVANHENLSGFQVHAGGKADLGNVSQNTAAKKIAFTFYMSENRFNPNSDLSGVYPSDLWLSSTEYDEYKQHYKPQVAAKSGGSPVSDDKSLATYVVLNGTYVDYRGTSWTVDYTVHLGKDNYQNFQVDRNSEYTNYLTIKGVRNNDGYTDAGSVWVDHRVNIDTDDLSENVTITRETLIDSHFEVRPLRVNWSGDIYAGVRVYLPKKDGKLVDWIGIERFTGENCLESATYCYAGNVPTGKRKYFTTSLISDLQNPDKNNGEFGIQEEDGEQFISLLNNECAWIYFDENVPVGEKESCDERNATIKLTFYSKEGKKVQDVLYEVTQQGSAPITGTNYIIESYEEYLHSYDSADKFDLSTSPADYTQQGLPWGWNERTFSHTKIASASQLIENDIMGVQSIITARYDYLHAQDEPGYKYYLKEDNKYTLLTNYGTGIDFTNTASDYVDITVKDMGTLPDNAYQYCLSKNKFTDNGDETISMNIHWYLPDTHELNTIIDKMQDVDNLDNMKSGAYYWSSQPSYENAAFNIEDVVTFKKEIPTEARAVSTKETNASHSRQRINRIRCFYSKEGIPANMTGRVPGGLGGYYPFIMRGNPADGYFKSIVPAPKPYTPENESSSYKYPKTDYPTRDNSFNKDGVEFTYKEIKNTANETKEGFTVNPQENWKEYKIDLGSYADPYATGYYTTLATYPGLSGNTLTKWGRSILDAIQIYIPLKGMTPISEIAGWIGIDVEQWLLVDAYKPDGNPLKVERTAESISKVEFTKSFTSETKLDPLNEKLNMSFNVASGSNKPTFIYNEVCSYKKQPYSKTWLPPKYTADNFDTQGDSANEHATGKGTSQGKSSKYLGGSEDEAKKDAFNDSENNSYNGAKKKAENAAKTNLEALVNSKYNSDWQRGQITYDPLSWDTIPDDCYTLKSYRLGVWTYECTVTTTAYMTLTLPGKQTLYVQAAGTGQWSDEEPGEPTNGETGLNTDELRIYSGNSFTISLSDNTYNAGDKTYKYSDTYEITKVKVYIRGGNIINDATLSSDTYGRFIDMRLAPEVSGEDETKITDLTGMEYSVNSDSDEVWQQWSGEGRNSVTLMLADCDEVASGISWSGIEYSYSYYMPRKKLSSYVIVDRIEVKCTKKATAATEQ